MVFVVKGFFFLLTLEENTIKRQKLLNLIKLDDEMREETKYNHLCIYINKYMTICLSVCISVLYTIFMYLYCFFLSLNKKREKR